MKRMPGMIREVRDLIGRFQIKPEPEKGNLFMSWMAIASVTAL
jgi:hypothetical protein